MNEPQDPQRLVPQPGGNEVDYRETADITRIHAAIKREHTDPVTRDVPLPMWFLVVCALAVGGAFFYLGSYSGSFSGQVYNETSGSQEAAGGPAGGVGPVAEVTLAQLGKTLYGQNCQNCHQSNGTGLPGQYPPLVKSDVVIGGSKKLLMVLLKGLQGPLQAGGGTYNGAMPAQEGSMTDKKIAAISTYIRSDWGNQAPEITAEEVAMARKDQASRTDPYAEADMISTPADASYMHGEKIAAPATK